MNEMVDRVAAALQVASKIRFDAAWSNDTTEQFARLAISAMREPTSDMLRGGLCGWNGVGIDHELSKYQSAAETWEAWRRAWRGVIDQALSEDK